MIASGLSFAVPALLTTLFAGICGVVCASIAWVQLGSIPGSRMPVAFYPFAGSVAVNVVSLPIVLLLPFRVQNGYIFGVDGIIFIWSAFLVASLALAAMSVKLLSTYSGLGRRALKAGSIILMVVYVLGFFAIVS